MTDIAVVVGAGASNGLGAALARRFAKGEFKVIVAGRTGAKVKALADEIIDSGGDAAPFNADVTSAADMNALFEFAGDTGDVKAVLYNAGNNALIPFEELTEEVFEDFWRVCCLGGFLTAKAALPALLKSDGGSLIFTGASASLRGKASFAHFASAKAGLRNLAQALAREYGPQGIHVGHVVVDGVIDGERVRTRFGDYLDQLGEDGSLNPDDMAETFWQMHHQPRNAWTHEIDIRPFKENW